MKMWLTSHCEIEKIILTKNQSHDFLFFLFYWTWHRNLGFEKKVANKIRKWEQIKECGGNKKKFIVSNPSFN